MTQQRQAIMLGGAMGLLVVVAPAMHTASPHAESSRAEPTAQDGSPERGRSLFSSYCSACHAAAGIPAAFTTIGPDLTNYQSQPLIVGVVPNTPTNLARWLVNPQSVKSDATMPPLGLSAAQANDLAAFLLPPPEPTPQEVADPSPAQD